MTTAKLLKRELFHEASAEEVIGWGYEQQAHNDEGLVDFEEAVMLAHENGCMKLPTDDEMESFRVRFNFEFDL